MKKLLFLIGLLPLAFPSLSAQQGAQTENLVLVTFDGLRWEELFEGATDSLMNDREYVRDTAALQQQFAAPTPEERRKKLLPFFWTTLAREGQLYGNRRHGNQVDVSNPFWFSYPGYNEILVGYNDPAVDSNDKKWNKNKTVLEWINEQPGFRNRVAAFASWDVFPYIINTQRSGIPVNAGFATAQGDDLTAKEAWLNELQAQIPSPWATVRLDAFTHNYALEYMKKYHPRVVYIAYGETDDFAHDGRYDHYLQSARQTSDWLAELWAFLQKDPVYAGKTTLLITTDHGRGHNPKDSWRSHGAQHAGSDAIWLAVIGPDTAPRGEVKEKGQLWQNQVAKTAAAFLGLEYTSEKEVGKVIEAMFE